MRNCIFRDNDMLDHGAVNDHTLGWLVDNVQIVSTTVIEPCECVSSNPPQLDAIAANGPDFKINVSTDILLALEAFEGFPYPFSPGSPCAPD